MKYIALDLETGGIGADKYSLLTGFFAVLNEKFEMIDKLEVALKSDVYRVSAKALEINKINLIEHEAGAKDQETIVNEINHFLKKHATAPFEASIGSIGGPEPLPVITPTIESLIPIGHNVHFDILFLKQALPGVRWDHFVSYRDELGKSTLNEVIISKLKAGEIVQCRPRGNSMTPIILSGQLVTVRPLHLRGVAVDPEVNDAVLCKIGRNIYLHKIYAKDDRRGYLIGNARGRMNGWTHQVFGVVTKAE